MQKILILSYHSLPMDVISSYRTKAYLDHLPRHNFEVTLLTFRWERGVDNDWMYHKKGESAHIEYPGNGVRIIRLPRLQSFGTRVLEKIFRIPFLNRIYILLAWVTGNLDVTPELLDSYKNYKKFIANHLNEEKYDLVVSIFSPHFHHRLAFEIYKKHKIPYVLDFRDLWSNRVIHKHYSPTLTEKIQDTFSRIFWRKWLNKALFFTITSDSWRKYINQFTNTDGYTIYNGFESEVFSSQEISRLGHTFSIVHTGSLYSNQNLDLFFEGYNMFINQLDDPSNVHLYLIGAIRQEAATLISKVNPEEKLKKILPEGSYTVTKRIPRKESLSYLKRATMLWMPSFPDSPGTISGKFFEYLGAKKFILTTPCGNRDIDELIEVTNSGVCLNSSEEIKDFLIKSYKEGTPEIRKNPHIDKFTRGHQIESFVEQVRKHLQ